MKNQEQQTQLGATLNNGADGKPHSNHLVGHSTCREMHHADQGADVAVRCSESARARVPAAELRMSSSAYRQIMMTVGARRPETGGILLGPTGSNEVTDFHFDAGAACTGGTYSPDHVTLNRKMKEEWLPAGIDMKGFVHSHPEPFDHLTGGDLTYIKRLLAKNEDMEVFAAPIVLPTRFQIVPITVFRQSPTVQQAARLVLFRGVTMLNDAACDTEEGTYDEL